MKRNKVFALLIIVLLAISLMPLVASAAPPAEVGEGKAYTIQKEDWLSRIAEKEFGDPLAYQAIVYYNNLAAAEDKTYAMIADADSLEVGWTIYIPTTDEASAFMSGEVAATVPTTFKQAPMLDSMGLPAVTDRLPAEPLVVVPVESMGEYGGTWHRAFKGVKDFHALGRLIYDAVLRWPRDPADPIQPGLAKDWKWSDGGRTLTLYFREGLKWSDGAPFTVDDVIFWWEDIELDTNITAAPHGEWIVDGKPMELEKVNDTTLKLKFAGPNGLAESVGLAFHGGQWPLGFERFGFFAPRHYLEQFHPKYNKAVDYKTFEDKAFNFNPDLPVMYAWRVSEWKTGATELVAERNPYYWKVDPAGNQLPYIDKIHLSLVEDNSAVNLKGIAGELDMQMRSIDFAQYTVYQENAAAGKYHTLLWKTAAASNITLFPNQSYADPKYRELLQNLKFRQALSLGIDRDTINKVSYLDQAVPRTITVVNDSPYYQADIEKYFAEFDPTAAQKLLDEMGLKKDAEGFYTFADGSQIQLVIEGTDAVSGASMDSLELIAENWKKIGLRTVLQTSNRDIYWPRACGNEVMIATWETDRGLVPMVDPIYQFPFDERSWMGPAFGTWYKSGGKQGEEPPAEMRAVQKLYDEYKTTVDPIKQVEIGKQIVREATEGLYSIGTVGMSPALVVVKDNFHNVMKNHTSDWIIFTPGTQDPPQFWIEQ